MRKEIINHLIYFAGYFVFLTIVNSLYSLNYWPLYIGGLVGLFMPNIDHLLHVFVLKPQELTSMRVTALFKNKQIKKHQLRLNETSDRFKSIKC